jgi:hypothetical protein
LYYPELQKEFKLKQGATLICLLLLLLASISGLSAQESVEPVPETPAPATVSDEYQQLIKAGLAHLAAGDSVAVDIICWDDFYLNGEDITSLYYEAYDNGTDLDFMNNIIVEISDYLKNADAANDPFTEWGFEDNGYEIYASCHNSVKQVEMWLDILEGYSLQLWEINITYR